MLKRLASVLLLMVFLAGCSGGRIEPRLSGISFRADMVYYDESYGFDGSVSESGVLTAVMTQPQELEGLEFTLDGDSSVVNYKGLTFTPTEGSIPFCRMLEDFYSKISSLINQPDLTADKEGIITKGRGAEACTLQLSPMGLPQTLEMPDERFCIKFYNIQIINEDVNE